MRFLSFLLLSFQVLFMVGLDLVLFSENSFYGIGGIIGIIGYFIAYTISVDMVISPSDFWFCSSWEIFKKKTSYAITTYLIVSFLSAGILSTIFN